MKIATCLSIGLVLWSGIANAQPPAPARQVNWTQLAPADSPSGRLSAMATANAGPVVLFGGLAPNNILLADTWVWDGTNWSQQFPTNSPPPRDCHVMAADMHGQVVLYGGAGNGGAVLGDTWVWSGDWSPVGGGPPARMCPAMTLDMSHGQIVLFGGEDGNGNLLGDTWVWDGIEWTQKFPTTSPIGRVAPSMTFGYATGQVVLFGGEGRVNGIAQPLSDTWIWDGSNWTEMMPTTVPPARDLASMASDTTGNIVLFGGIGSAFQTLGDTWVWDGANWSRNERLGSPPRRHSAAMSYDNIGQGVLLFGGLNTNGAFLADTWIWSR